MVPVATLVPRTGWWSDYPQFGEEQAFEPDAQNRQQILKADELGPPEVYTLTLGISYTEQDWPGTRRAFGIEAEINFGAGGATQVVKIDWAQGAQISLPMNAVNVVASYSIDALAAPQPPADLRLSVMLGRGPALGKSHWTDPTPLSLVAAGQTPPRRIAAFASRLHVVASSPAGADLLYSTGNFLIFLGGPVATDEQIASVRLDQYLNAIGEGIVIPGQAKYASIFNLSGSVLNARARLQYDIF
ncbi:MAG TPA: hypothetical protein VJV79_33695 [Polyangiaceae bacterium]|nr:hypothetical protein [Polyangiaceae bacterium]